MTTSKMTIGVSYVNVNIKTVYMYSIMCVYMHHICIYNVYVYIFVVNFPPLCFLMILGMFLFVVNVHIHLSLKHSARSFYGILHSITLSATFIIQ